MATLSLNKKPLPTNYKAPKKPSYRHSILQDEDVKQILLRHQQQPTMDRVETEKYRNTYKKQLCIQLLSKGYHKSFTELEEILKLQIEYRYKLGSEHPVWDKPLLDQEHAKLDYLCLKLNEAEIADRNQSLVTQYESYQDLANYFLAHDENWLSDYFFDKCLKIMSIDESLLKSQKSAESQCNLGLAFERQGAYHEAMRHFETYYDLSKAQKEWQNERHLRLRSEQNPNTPDINDCTKYNHDAKLFIDSCINLQRIYKVIANKSAQDNEEKIAYLTKAFDVCKESGIRPLEGQICFILGQTYKDNDDLDTALVCFQTFYDISKRNSDLDNYGKASEALATCHRKMGNVNKSIEYLQKFLNEVSPKQANKQYASVCSCLANIYNSLGRYKESEEVSKKAYDISRTISDHKSIEINRMIYGISKAHEMLGRYNKLIEANSRDTIEHLLVSKFKDN